MDRGKEENIGVNGGIEGGWALRNWFGFKIKRGKVGGNTYPLYL
tara:strand:+ start:264 stop:395 length:132 start_codon:yes stop_codon:yes gene_type:complete